MARDVIKYFSKFYKEGNEDRISNLLHSNSVSYSASLHSLVHKSTFKLIKFVDLFSMNYFEMFKIHKNCKIKKLCCNIVIYFSNKHVIFYYKHLLINVLHNKIL